MLSIVRLVFVVSVVINGFGVVICCLRVVLIMVAEVKSFIWVFILVFNYSLNKVAVRHRQKQDRKDSVYSADWVEVLDDGKNKRLGDYFA